MIQVKQKMGWVEVEAFLVLEFSPLFILAYWEGDLRLPTSQERPDLPVEYHDYDHVLSYNVLESWCDTSPRQQFCTSRKWSKTLRLEAYIIQKCITYTGSSIAEALFFTPRENHLYPVVNRVKSKVSREPLFAMMLENWNSSKGIVNWKNGSVLHLRIEGSNGGENMVGLRAKLFVVGDEMAYSSENAESERKNTMVPGCPIIYAGVPNGIRSSHFYARDKTRHGDGWRRHRGSIIDNPLYHSEWAMREELDKHKGGTTDQTWITQVKGEWGEESFQSFPVIPILRDRLISFTTITPEVWAREPVETLVTLPFDLEPQSIVMHADVGYAPAPTVLGISYLIEGTWVLVARIVIKGVPYDVQASIFHAINREVLPTPAELIGIDAHGAGSGLLYDLHSKQLFAQNAPFDYTYRVFDVGFASYLEEESIWLHKECSHVVRMEDGAWLCDHCHKVIYTQSQLKHPKVQAKQKITQDLKSMFVQGATRVQQGNIIRTDSLKNAIVILRDSELMAELEGTTEYPTQDGYNIRYVPPDGNGHNTDMLRALVSTIHRYNAADLSGAVDEWLQEAGFFHPVE